MMYGGLGDFKEVPGAVVVIDAKHEAIAVEEAAKKNIPVIALCGSDNNLKEVTYPIVGNDSSKSSILFFLKQIAKTYSGSKK